MSILVKCPNPDCGRQYTVKPELAGQTVKCDVCRSSIQVPTIPPASAPPRPQGAPHPTPPAPNKGGEEAPISETPPTKDPLLGKRVAHYDILSVLGEGGMGVVYKARNVNLDRIVALKILPDSVMRRGQAYVDRFLQEARAAARLNHPNVVAVHHIGQAAGKLFIEMEYMDGGTLLQKMKQVGRLAPPVAARVARDCASALAAAHAQGIIHRDIKPRNILLASAGEQTQPAKPASSGAAASAKAPLLVKLCDFGLARFQDDKIGLSETGLAIGTPLYMSPEQAKGEPVTPLSDIYSLGCVLYHLAVGKPPFEGSSSTSVMYKHVHKPTPLVRQEAPYVSAPLAAIIERMMAKDPQQRYHSAAEVVAQLDRFFALLDERARQQERSFRPESILESVPTPPPAKIAPAKEERRVSHVRFWVGVAAVLVIAGSVVFNVALWRQRPKSVVTPATPKAPTEVTQPGPVAPSPPPAPEAAPPTPAPVIAPPTPAPAVAPHPPAPYTDYVTTAATGDKIPHPLSKKVTVLRVGELTVEVPEGMVFIPPGEFLMGMGKAPPNGPEHKVWLDGYAIGKYPVTNAEWMRFTDATRFRPLPANWTDGEIPPAKENHPVVDISWEDAQKYCSWVSGATGRRVRLPTEAEWEKAARGQKGQLHTWGNEPGAAVKPAAADLAGGSTLPVGAVPQDKSPFGCYDMGGNGFEWCEDWFQFDYYLKSPDKNPRGPTESEAWEAGDRGLTALARVLRGGSWANYAEGREVAQRNAVPPSTRHLDFGFRIACDVSPR